MQGRLSSLPSVGQHGTFCGVSMSVKFIGGDVRVVSEQELARECGGHKSTEVSI